MKVVIILSLSFYFLQALAYPGAHRLQPNNYVREVQQTVPKSKDGIHQLPPTWCGFHANPSIRNRGRSKRFVLQGSRWRSNPVTYNISKYPESGILSPSVIDREIDAAFRMWEDVSNLAFKRETVGKVNIDIRFETKHHGDDDPFDGIGGMTAHAYYPQYGGNIHFDNDETWTTGSQKGINFFQVATHEIGHALGLEHTDAIGNAVMSPYYNNFDPNFKMHPDDIAGIQHLYGKKSYPLCGESKVDAAVTMIDGGIYLFKGNLVYRFHNLSSRFDMSYPKEISAVFDNLVGPVDAAFTRSNGLTYFFKGNEFWRFSNMTMDMEFPKNVSDFFPNIPTPLDAAVVFPSNENIYFIKGGFYWKFDPTKTPSVSSDYPKSISTWKGVPSAGFDAALRTEENGIPAVYFFKDNQFWRFNDNAGSVYITNPPYPRYTRTLFAGCRIR